MKITLTLITILMLVGCEYQTRTERRVALFYKSENGGDVHKSRDIGSFVQNRQQNSVDRWLYRATGQDHKIR